jgi:ribulose-phosphate 3-epimerase
MIKISPSILNCDFLRLGDEIKRIEAAGADMIHIDVMDGYFVPNISFGFPIVEAVRRATTLPLDVHLMITEPQRYIDEFAACGANIITIHTESLEQSAISDAIKQIKSYNISAALSIKPRTDETELFRYLPDIDMVLVMTVEPGFGGQKLIPLTLEKVNHIRTEAINRNIELDIQVDGGVNLENYTLVKAAGANVFVMGTALLKSDDPKAVVDEIKRDA